MRNRAARLTFIVFSVLFAIRVLSIFVADQHYNRTMPSKRRQSTPQQAMVLLDVARKLDSTNAKIYFREYEMLEALYRSPETVEGMSKAYINKLQLLALRRCINICPSQALYHIDYAITLKRMSPNPNIITKDLILSEVHKAARLRPYSELYQKIYRKYLKKFSRS